MAAKPIHPIAHRWLIGEAVGGIEFVLPACVQHNHATVEIEADAHRRLARVELSEQPSVHLRHGGLQFCVRTEHLAASVEEQSQGVLMVGCGDVPRRVELLLHWPPSLCLPELIVADKFWQRGFVICFGAALCVDTVISLICFDIKMASSNRLLMSYIKLQRVTNNVKHRECPYCRILIERQPFLFYFESAGIILRVAFFVS